MNRAVLIAQAAAAAIVLLRLSRGRIRRPVLGSADAPAPVASLAGVSVVIPARNEQHRIGPCLEGLMREPDLGEVIVVDDGSTDATAVLAGELGARVVTAGDPPPGWVGKPWALQRGLESARGEIVICLDADTRPELGLVAAVAGALRDVDLVSVGARFICDTAGESWLHPAMLITLVYRFGPPDGAISPRASRLVVSGQCIAARREQLLTVGGFRHSAGHLTDDIAQGRALARLGWRVAFHGGGDLIGVDMHDSIGETWREWGRSIAMRDTTPGVPMALDVAVVWLALGLPTLRVAVGRAGRLDLALLGLRWAMTIPLARTYRAGSAAYWLSPFADPLAAVRLTLSAVRPSRRWRDRVYDVPGGTAVR